ncbi:853_t:CDS:1, partial [Ambispora leptoticha]
SASPTINAQNQEIARLTLINARYKKELQKLNEKIQKQAEQEKKSKVEQAAIQNQLQKTIISQQKEIDKLQVELQQSKNEADENDENFSNPKSRNEMKKIQDQTSLLEEAQQEIEKLKEREIEYENVFTIQQGINNKLTELMEQEIELRVKMEIERKDAEIKLRLEWEHEAQKEERKEYHKRIEDLLRRQFELEKENENLKLEL